MSQSQIAHAFGKAECRTHVAPRCSCHLLARCNIRGDRNTSSCALSSISAIPIDACRQHAPGHEDNARTHCLIRADAAADLHDTGG